jgi:hypothetical protein
LNEQILAENNRITLDDLPDNLIPSAPKEAGKPVKATASPPPPVATLSAITFARSPAAG